MLKIQEWLIENNRDYKKLEEEYGISAVFKDDLVILNYSQIDSPKMEQIVIECRGICLDLEGNVIAKAFNRFFNYGEAVEITEKFDWESIIDAYEKVDGSLIKIFKHKGKMHIQTRGSFADSELVPGKTWEDCVREAITPEIDYFIKNTLVEGLTFVFEYCGPYNQVVRIYPEPKLVLLGVIENTTGEEYSQECMDDLKLIYHIERPIKYSISTIKDVENLIHETSLTDATWEGIVVQDRNGLRLKIKSPKYLALHKMSGNGNIFLNKNLIPFVLEGETDELFTYFPATKPFVEELSVRVDNLYKELYNVYIDVKDIENQKDFAIAIQNKTPLTSILFRLKKAGTIQNEKELKKMFIESKDLILKVIE